MGNLSWSVSWQDLKDFFAPYGAVYADVKFTADGYSKGWGIVRFATVQQTAAAMAAANGAELKGRAMRVREDRGPNRRLEVAASNAIGDGPILTLS